MSLDASLNAHIEQFTQHDLQITQPENDLLFVVNVFVFITC
jgi:hypothetical protein